jgi:hypothetical protein
MTLGIVDRTTACLCVPPCTVAVSTTLQRILIASAPLQRMMLDEKSGLVASVPALCQALCILLAGQAQADSFVHRMIRSALLVKVDLGGEQAGMVGCRYKQ